MFNPLRLLKDKIRCSRNKTIIEKCRDRLDENESRIFKHFISKIVIDNSIESVLMRIDKRIINFRSFNIDNPRTFTSMVELTDTVVTIADNFYKLNKVYSMDKNMDRSNELRAKVYESLENLDILISMLSEDNVRDREIDLISTCDLINKLVVIKGLKKSESRKSDDVQDVHSHYKTEVPV